MKKMMAGALFVSLGLALAPAALAADGIEGVDARWLAGMKANDAAAIAACYAPDAVLWLPDAPEARGEKAILEAYQGWLSANTIQAVSLSNTQSATSGDTSVGWGNFEITMQPKSGGAAVVMKGRFTGVAKKRGGKWLYVSDHASNTPKP
jgi:uncharacterized protein (TIGR02246 family)